MIIKTARTSYEVFSKKDIKALPDYKKIRKQLPKNSTYVGLRFSKLHSGEYAIKVAIYQYEAMHDLYFAITNEDPSKIGIKAKEFIKPIEIGDSC